MAGTRSHLKRTLLLVLTMIHAQASAGMCDNSFKDFFCDGQMEPSSDFWRAANGNVPIHGKVSGIGGGGVEFFQRGMLVSKSNFAPSKESPVTVRAIVHSSARMSDEFDICTRSDGTGSLLERTVLEYEFSPNFNGLHALSSKYFVQNGVCLHISKDTQNPVPGDRKWTMKILVVGPGKDAVCQPSALVTLQVVEGEYWEVTLTDDGDEIRGTVERPGLPENTTTVSLNCAESLPTDRSAVAMFDYYKEDRQSNEKDAVKLSFISISQPCPHLVSVDSDIWKVNSMPCSTPLTVYSGESTLTAKVGGLDLDQSRLWDMPLSYQARVPSDGVYNDSQAFLLLVHVSRVGLQNANSDVAVRMEASVCGSMVASLASNPRRDSNDGEVKSSPMSLHGLVTCSSPASREARDDLNLAFFTTRDGRTPSTTAGPILMVGVGDGRDAGYGEPEIIVTAVRLLRETTVVLTGEASATVTGIPVSGSATGINFLAGVGSSSSMTARTTQRKRNLLLFFDAPTLISTELGWSCLKFSFTVNGVAVSNKATCLPLQTNVKYYPFRMHAVATVLDDGTNEADVGVVFERTERSCYSQDECTDLDGNLITDGPWRLTAVAVSDRSFFSERKTVAADSTCVCHDQPILQRTAWKVFEHTPVLEVNVTYEDQEVLLFADLDRLDTCTEQSIGFRIVRVEDSFVVSEISFFLTALPPQSFSWHGSVSMQPGTHTFVLEYTYVYPVLCSQFDEREHKLSALILPDVELERVKPAFLPRFAQQESSASVTITGGGFEQDSTVARMGGTACIQTSWSSDSSLVCKIGPGVAQDLKTTVTIDLVGIRTKEDLFSYPRPLVSRSANSPPNAPDSAVTVLGKSFGLHDYTPIVTVGTTKALMTHWESDTSIAYNPAPGVSVAVVNTFVSGYGVDTNETLVYHTFDAPFVTNVNPLFAPTSGASSITLLGGNFGNADYSLAMSVDETRCSRTGWQSETSIICVLPPGIGNQLRVAAVSFEQDGEREIISSLNECTHDYCKQGLTLAFSYSAPVVDSLRHLYKFLDSPEGQFVTKLGVVNGPPTGDTTITAFGTNFGPGPYKHTLLSLRVGGTTCSNTTWSSPTMVTCKVVPGVHYKRDVVLTVARQVGTGDSVFSYDVPTRLPEEVTFAPADAEAEIMTVRGKNFGTQDWSPVLSIGQTKCIQTAWTSDSSIVASIPDGVGRDLPVSVPVGHENASLVASPTILYRFSYASPSEAAPAPESSNLPSTGGANHTINAVNFGTTDYTARLGVHGTSCESSGWFSDTSMTCKSPAGAGFTRVLSATVASQRMENGLTVSFDIPAISSVKQANAAVSTEGTMLTMFGKDFGIADYSPKVRIGKTACTMSVWTSATSLAVKTAWSFDINLGVMVTLERSVGTLSDAFTFDGIFAPIPHVERTVPEVVPTTGGYDITVLGAFLGPEGLKLPDGMQTCLDRTPPKSPASEDCPFIAAEDMSWRASVAYQDCEGHAVGTACETTTWVSESSLFCTTPIGVGSNLGVVVETWPPDYSPFLQARSTGFRKDSISHKTPDIVSSTPNIPAASGEHLSITGSNFGKYDTSAMVRIAGTACSSTIWTSDSSMSCKVQSGRWSNEAVVVTMSEYSCHGLSKGVPHTIARPFAYDDATITTMNVTDARAKRFEIYGLNFGTSDLSPTVHVLNSAAPMTRWVSDTSIAATYPTGVGGKLDLTVEYVRNLTRCIEKSQNETANETRTEDADHVNVTRRSSRRTDTNQSDEEVYECEAVASFGTEFHRAVLPEGFSYPLPMPVNLSMLGVVEWSGNVTITVEGTNFGQFDYSPQARVGRTSCEAARWLSSTALTCKVGPGSHAGGSSLFLPIAVTVQGQVGKNEIFEYEDKGAVKLTLACAACVDPANGAVNKMEGLVLDSQPRLVVVDAWNRPVNGMDTAVTVSVVQATGGRSTVEGTTAVHTKDGMAVFTDLVVRGASAGFPVRLRFSSEGFESVLSKPFNVLYVSCPPAFLFADPLVASFLGGTALLLQLRDFFPFPPEALSLTFEQQQIGTASPYNVSVPIVRVTSNPALRIASLTAVIPAWPLELEPTVDVSLNIAVPGFGSSRCFEAILMDLSLPRVTQVAPGVCTTEGGGTNDIIMTDTKNIFERQDFEDLRLIMRSGNAEVGRVQLSLNSYLDDGTRILSFPCEASNQLGTFGLSIEIARGAKANQLVCCSDVFFEPVGGFALEYVPPPAVVSPINVIPSKSHHVVQLLVYYAPEMFGVDEANLDTCTAMLEGVVMDMSLISKVEGSTPTHEFEVSLPSIKWEGNFPRSVPVLIQCEGSSLPGPVSSEASLVYFRQPNVTLVTPPALETYGGFITVEISYLLFPLRAEDLVIEIYMPSGAVVVMEQFSIIEQGKERTTFSMKIPQSVGLVPKEAFILFSPQVVPDGVDMSFFVGNATFQYFQPPPQILEMEPNVVSALGNEEITILVTKLVALSSPSDVVITIAGQPTPLEVTRIIFSDLYSTSLRFMAPPSTPGPTEILLAPAIDRNNTGLAILTYNGIGVSATCTKVQKDDTSAPVEYTGSLCIVSSSGSSKLTYEMAGFGTDLSDLRIAVGGIPVPSSQWTAISAPNQEPIVIELFVFPMSPNVKRGDDGCVPAQVPQNIAVFLASDDTKMAISQFIYNTIPCLTHSSFSASGVELELRFNQQTDQGGIIGSEFFPCSRVLSLDSRKNPWGDGGFCFWINARQLNVQLGPGEDDELVNVDDFVLLTKGLQIKPLLGFNLTAEGTYRIRKPAQATLPGVRISGPNEASSCALDELVLTGLVTSPRSVRYRWGANDENLNAFVSLNSGPVLAIPSTELVSGRDYAITLDVVDFLDGTSAQESHKMRKVSGFIPVVRIDGTRPFLASASNFFVAIVRFSSCIKVKGEMSFDWKVVPSSPALVDDDPFNDPEPVFVSDAPSLDVPPGVLEPGAAYTILLVAGSRGQVPGHGSFDFETSLSPLLSAIDGGDRVQPRGSLLELDASLSRDPDRCLLFEDQNDVFDITDDCFKDVTGGTPCTLPCLDDGLVFEWACLVKGLPCRAKDYSLVMLPNDPFITFDLSILADNPTSVTFEVSVSKGIRTSTSAVRISVIELSEVPALDIVLSFTRKIDSAGIRYINRPDKIRGLAVTDYCDSDAVDCTDEAQMPKFSYSVWESIDKEEIPGNVVNGEDGTQVPSGLQNQTIIINPNVLVTGKQYALKLSMTIGALELSSARLFLQVNQPPSAGKCKIQPTTGMEISTSFAATCEKWFDQDLPLQYIFGFKARESDKVMVTPAQLGATYDLRLPAGLVDVTISVLDALGAPAITQLLALVNTTEADADAADDLESMTKDSGKLGDTSSLLQQSSSTASQLSDTTARRLRRLLASSAAYRMRVRRMLLNAAKGASPAVDKTSGGPMLGNVEGLSGNPEEVAPPTVDPRESSASTADSADLVFTSVCSVTPLELSGEAADKAMASLSQLISAVSRLPAQLRDRTLLSAMQSVTQICRSLGKAMSAGEPPRTLGRGDFVGSVQKVNPPADPKIVVNNSVPGLWYSFEIASWLQPTAEIVLPSVFIEVPWQANLTSTGARPITSLFGVEVVLSKVSRRRRGRRTAIASPAVGATQRSKIRRGGPIRPFRRADEEGPPTFGFPDGGTELNNGFFVFRIPIKMSDFNETEQRNIQYLTNFTVQCLSWDSFSWTEFSCETPRVYEDETVECRCRQAGLFIVTYTPPTPGVDRRPVAAVLGTNFFVLANSIWYSLTFGVTIFLVTIVVKVIWAFRYSAAVKMTQSHHVKAAAREHVLCGWFGEIYPDESQFRKTFVQRISEGRARSDAQSFKGTSLNITKDGDQTLTLMLKVDEYEDQNNAKYEVIVEQIVTEIASVLGVSKSRVCLGELDQIEDDLAQFHVFYTHSLLRPARKLASQFEYAFDKKQLQQMAARKRFFGEGARDLQYLNKITELRMGYDPVGLFMKTAVLESFNGRHDPSREPRPVAPPEGGEIRSEPYLYTEEATGPKPTSSRSPAEELPAQPPHDSPPHDSPPAHNAMGTPEAVNFLRKSRMDDVPASWNRASVQPMDASLLDEDSVSFRQSPEDVDVTYAGVDPDTIGKLEQVNKSIQQSNAGRRLSSTGRRIDDNQLSDLYGVAISSYLEGL